MMGHPIGQKLSWRDIMKISKLRSTFCFSMIGLLALGCGQSNDERAVSSTSSSLITDSAESEAAVSASLGEALDSLSDTNMVSNASSLSLLNLAADASFTMDRKCTEQDSKALVTINIDKSISWERTLPRFTINASSTIENEISRTWMKEGSDVACTANGKFAAIDFESDLSGYQLDVTIDRSAARKLERLNLKTQEKITRSLASSVTGTRQVQWLSQSALADGSISRSKSLSFTTERSDSFEAKDGIVKDLKLSIATLEAAPLQVTVIWDKLSKGRQLLSKEIESGTIKASRQGGGSIETSFNKMLMKFTSTSCELVSGTLEAKIYVEGESPPAKIYQLTAEEGTVTVKDVTDPAKPETVEDFDYSPCDIKDFNF